MKSSIIADELNGCLVINEITGLQYFSLKNFFKDKSRKGTHFCRKIVFCFYLVAYLTFIFIALPSAPFVNASLTSQNVILVLFRVIRSFSKLVGYLAFLIQSYVSTENVKKFFLNTQLIAEWSHQDFYIEMNFAKVRRDAWYRFFAINLYWALPYCGIIYVNSRSLGETVYMAVFAIFYVGFSLAIATKNIFFIMLINFQLRHLEKLLQSIFQPQYDLIVGKVYDLTIGDNKSEDGNMKQLLVVWKIYNKINENADLINNSMDASMIFILINAVMAFLTSGYELVISFVSSQNANALGNAFVCYDILLKKYFYCRLMVHAKFIGFDSFDGVWQLPPN